MQTNGWNPYHAQTPISDPRMFFGSLSVLFSIYSAVANRQNVSLVGLRHSGKTTLLLCLNDATIQERFGFDFSHHLLVYLDIRNCLRRTSDGFFDFLCEEMLAASQGRINILPSPKTGEDRFIEILRQVKNQGCHPVLLLDVFDDITRSKAFDPEFFMFLRAQASAGRVSYVTASIAPLTQIAHAAIQGSPFFNIFGLCRMKPLAPQEARDLVMIPSHRAGCPFTEDECEWILKQAGRHPFFIHRLCYYLFGEKSQGKEVNRKRVANQTYHDLLPHFTYMWRDLGEAEKEAQKEESQHSSSLERAMPELSESAFFRKFVRETCNLQFFHMSKAEIEEELKEALKHLDSLAFLANSKLKYLKQVAARIEQQNASSTLEKGRVIREILKEALEQLGGHTPRTDTDPEWLLYNVLRYTYFKKTNGFTQELIANDLGMSLRQYHRKKDEAISAICNRLLEVEAAYKGENEE